MKLLKKFPVAVAVTALVVALSIMYSVATAPAAMIDVTVGNWVQDDAGVLSEETEQQIRQWNAQWGASYDCYVAVATVKSMSGWDEDDYCLTVAENWELIESDMILVLDIGTQTPYFYEGGAYPDLDLNYYITTYLTEDFLAGRYDEGVLSLLEELDGYFASVYVTATPGYDDGGYYNGYDDGYWEDWNENPYSSITSTIRRMLFMPILILIIAAIVVLQAIDRSRYRRWYGMYGGMATPPVMFRPILFWNRRGFGPRPPMGGGPRPPMGGPRPPAGGAGQRPPMGTSRPGGSNSRPPMGGSGTRRPLSGFSSRPSSGGGSRGGSFGGGSRGGGGSFGGRGGSFGGRK